jgi:hypothetical protein
MTERRVTGLRRALVAPLFRRALALAALLATALAATASLATEASLAAGCDAQSMLADPGAAGTAGAACVAPDLERDQAYLVETARPGATMLHQGLALAIVRLHPMFVRRLAEAIGEARGLGLPSAGIFSAYRPPAFGVGGFSDKFSSLHTYGLAVDLLGVGGPGSSEAKHWYEIASRHAIVCPYGAGNRREWNHCQSTGVKSIMAGDPLRDTVSPQGPIDREAMFAMGDALVGATDAAAGAPESPAAVDEKTAAGRGVAIETGHDQTGPSHETHRRVGTVAGSAGQAKRGIVAHIAPGKSGSVKKVRTASLSGRDAFSAHAKLASSKAPTKRIDHEDVRLDRTIKGICRSC